MQHGKVKRRDLLFALTGLGASVAASQFRTQAANGSDPYGLFAQGRTFLTGAGASFPAPLYGRWFVEYNQQNPNIEVNYQSVGSGSGVKQFIQGTVDFGASDVAMKDSEIAQVSRGVVLLPMTAGSVVVAYNAPVSGLKLSREQLADVFLGKITNWRDLDGPNAPVRIVHRSDGSGTTAVFTKYLHAISKNWANGPGTGKTIQWPVGIGGKGNEGVTAQIRQTPGSLGYVEFGYAKNNGLKMAALENQSGSYIAPSLDSAKETLAAVTLPENLRAFIVDPSGPNSYPIVTYTWIMAYKNYSDRRKVQALQQVLKWALTEGQTYSPSLGYIPLPLDVKLKVMEAVNNIG